MSSQSDFAPESTQQPYAVTPAELAPREDSAAVDRFQEINERRARVENSELLQHLRGL